LTPQVAQIIGPSAAADEIGTVRADIGEQVCLLCARISIGTAEVEKGRMTKIANSIAQNKTARVIPRTVFRIDGWA
jgi:hypothetical protein